MGVRKGIFALKSVDGTIAKNNNGIVRIVENSILIYLFEDQGESNPPNRRKNKTKAEKLIPLMTDYVLHAVMNSVGHRGNCSPSLEHSKALPQRH